MRRLAIVAVAVLAMSGCNVRYGWGADVPVRGSNATAPTDVGSGKAWRTVDAGMERSCAIDADRRLVCEAFDCEEEVHGPALEPQWTAVATGYEHTCAIWGAGDLYCWGSNASGALGTGDDTTAYRSAPQQVGTASDWRTVAAGEHGTCAIRGAGELWCWGGGSIVGGVVGDGTTASRTTPTRIGTASDWTTVSVEARHSCGVRGGGELWCWSSDGRSGDGTGQIRLSPVRIGSASNWRTVSVSPYHSCGLRGGDLWCWGQNDYGEVGDGTTTARLAPVRIGGTSDWTTISAGGTDRPGGSGGGGEYFSAHTCGIRRPGTLWCWGLNAKGELGDGTTATRIAPTRVGTASDCTAVSSGGSSTDGVRAEA